MELEALLDRQLRLAGRGANAATIEAVAAERSAAAVRLEQRTAALQARAPQLLAPTGSEPLTLETAQAALGADEALMVAAVGDSSTGIFAVTRQNVAMTMAPVGRQEIGLLVDRVRDGLTPEALATGTAFDFDASSRLHAMLFPAAVLPALSGKPRLLVAANASLGALPFAILAPRRPRPTVRNARWLVRDYALVTLPSIAAIASARSASAEGRKIRSFFAVGAPDLAMSGSATAFRSANMARQVRDLSALPATEPELRALGRALAAPEQLILTGSRATESAVRAADLSRTDVLAFATHGLTAGDLDGLDEPALVMTPEGDDDGLLTASEIMRLRLAADWTILSACNTAGGGGADGSELAGLARAFLYAGGRNLLVSHWAVRDDAAAYLSVETVRRYGLGIDPAQALRQAMLRMIDKRPFDGAEKPINWAPFVFVGR